MTELIRLLIQSSLIAIFLTGLVGWWRLGRWYFREGEGRQSTLSEKLNRLIVLSKQERPTWSPADFLLAFGLRILIAIFLVGVFTNSTGRSAASTSDSIAIVETAANEEIASTSDSMEPILQLTLQVAAITASILLTIGWLSILHRDSWRRLGFHGTAVEIKLALISTPLILSAVMLFSLIASAILEYEHPVLESIVQENSLAFIALTFVATALVTPVFEEFLFRGLLQGSLQAIADPMPETGEWQPISVWPILLSSFVFAVMHFPGQGAAPIPIFVLSLGLGYLYRQTGSLVPPIIVHVLLNSITLLDALMGN